MSCHALLCHFNASKSGKHTKRYTRATNQPAHTYHVCIVQCTQCWEKSEYADSWGPHATQKYFHIWWRWWFTTFEFYTHSFMYSENIFVPDLIHGNLFIVKSNFTLFPQHPFYLFVFVRDLNICYIEFTIFFMKICMKLLCICAFTHIHYFCDKFNLQSFNYLMAVQKFSWEVNKSRDKRVTRKMKWKNEPKSSQSVCVCTHNQVSIFFRSRHHRCLCLCSFL